MKTKLLVATLMAGSSLFAETHFSFGIGIGNGYAAPPAYAVRPAYPRPGFVWVDGFWENAGPRRVWRNGYWKRQVLARPFGAPRRDNRNFFDRDRFDNNRFDNNRSDNNRDDHRDNDRNGRR